MRDDERFEIERAFDLLPHVAGASWAAVWFRLNAVRNPTADEFRERAAGYFKMLDPLYGAFPCDGRFEEMSRFIRWRRDEEVRRIIGGLNPEIEKRYRRYVDYG